MTRRQAAIENGKKGGRPPLSPAQRKRFIVSERGDPLLAMEGNLIFWKEHVEKLSEQLRNLIVAADSEEERAEAFKLLRELLACRENVQRCAVDLAPYCYPKYHSVDFTADPGNADRPQLLIGFVRPDGSILATNVAPAAAPVPAKG